MLHLQQEIYPAKSSASEMKWNLKPAHLTEQEMDLFGVFFFF